MMIKEIKNDILTLNESPKFYQVMSREEDEIRMRNSMFKEGETVGFERGESVGIEENNRENAKRMKKKNIPNETIQEITGLSLNTIINL